MPIHIGATPTSAEFGSFVKDAEDAIFVLESYYGGKINVRSEDDGSLTSGDPGDYEPCSAAEVTTALEARTLADAQATFDEASTALEDAGGEPCPA